MKNRRSFVGLTVRSLKLMSLLTAVLFCLVCLAGDLTAEEPLSSGAILQELRSFRELGTVLLIAAHPDDENTRLIAYFARERGYRVAYLSLTRGDGGQNLLGPELGEALGAIRTEELLAARRIDGGEQFFTRAIDFGFSKSADETLRLWDRQAVLGDIVRIIRTYQPDVLFVPFPPQSGGGGHGHHVAASILGLEAFKLAGDPKAYPEQLGELKPWQPTRVLAHGGRGPGGSPPPGAGAPAPGSAPSGIILDLGGFNHLLGESIGEIAARSRSMHRSQGFGSVGYRGASPSEFRVIAGETANRDFFDGIDTSWSRVAGGEQIGRLAEEALRNFDPQAPAASVPTLLAIRRLLAALPDSAVVAAKRKQLDGIVQACLGLFVETTIPQAEVIAGEDLKLRHTAITRAVIPVRWKAVRYPAQGGELTVDADLPDNTAVWRDSVKLLPRETPTSQPYWLRREGTIGTYRVDTATLIGRPENPPVVPVEFVFEIGGETLIVSDEPVQVIGDRAKGEVRRRLEVIPPVTLHFAQDVVLLTPGARRPVTVEVEATRGKAAGSLRIDAPPGWNVQPERHDFVLPSAAERAVLTFEITAPRQPAKARLRAVAEVEGVRFENRLLDIQYDHIPRILLQPEARLTAVSLDLAIRGQRIGYLPGAGDDVAQCLSDMGYAVITLTGADLSAERLREFDAVVLGVRAFNTRTDIAGSVAGLFAYAEAGGTVIAQYSRPGRDLKTEQLAPYRLSLSNDRVTEEDAAVRLLAPDHPVLNTPNKITAADFEGWVQERGVYFASQWDERFTPILATGDTGAKPLNGGLLVARHGRGWFVYTGLAFFRQLPDGVPGAYRLLANLIALGSQGVGAQSSEGVIHIRDGNRTVEVRLKSVRKSFEQPEGTCAPN
jgi:LmbE family N-acetylglucosaminyl deacetylase